MAKTQPTPNDLEKEKVANEILANPVYTHDAGLIRILRNAMVYGRLSLQNLNDLKLVLDLKIQGAADDRTTKRT